MPTDESIRTMKYSALRDRLNLLVPKGGRAFLKAVAASRGQSMTEFIVEACLHEIGLSAWPDGHGWEEMSPSGIRNSIRNAQRIDGTDETDVFYVSPADAASAIKILSSIKNDPFDMPKAIRLNRKQQMAIHKILSIKR